MEHLLLYIIVALLACAVPAGLYALYLEHKSEYPSSTVKGVLAIWIVAFILCAVALLV